MSTSQPERPLADGEVLSGLSAQLLQACLASGVGYYLAYNRDTDTEHALPDKRYLPLANTALARVLLVADGIAVNKGRQGLIIRSPAEPWGACFGEARVGFSSAARAAPNLIAQHVSHLYRATPPQTLEQKQKIMYRRVQRGLRDQNGQLTIAASLPDLDRQVLDTRVSYKGDQKAVNFALSRLDEVRRESEMQPLHDLAALATAAIFEDLPDFPKA